MNRKYPFTKRAIEYLKKEKEDRLERKNERQPDPELRVFIK